MVDLQLGDLKAAEGAESEEGKATARAERARQRGAGTHLVVLVGGDRHEGRLREGEGLEDAPAHAEEVVSLHQVEARMVAVHGVEDNLEEEQEEEEEEGSVSAQPIRKHAVMDSFCSSGHDLLFLNAA